MDFTRVGNNYESNSRVASKQRSIKVCEAPPHKYEYSNEKDLHSQHMYLGLKKYPEGSGP